MSVVQDNEAVCMPSVVTVHSLATSGLNYCYTSNSQDNRCHISQTYSHKSSQVLY